MAVMIGKIHYPESGVQFRSEPLRWVGRQLVAIFQDNRHNPSPFPDRVWSRHSALLDSAWKLRR